MSQHALGFDVGLSGVRAAVLRDDGALVASSRRPHEREYLADGIAEHDPADWLEGVLATGREALARAGDARIDCIGVAALGPAPLLVDEDLRPLTRARLFSLDRRAEPQRKQLLEEASAQPAAVTLSRVLPNLAPLADERAATLDNALPKLAWWAEHEPAVLRRAAWALDATGFVVTSLTGVPVMDSITAHDYELPGVEATVPSPTPLDPMETAGELRTGWAERLGLPEGLPVIAGTYDSFVDIAAAGVRRPGDNGVVLGSTMIICRAAAHDALAPPGLGSSAYPGEGILIGGWTLSGGLALDWFERRFDGSPGLAAAATQVEPGGLLALPYLAGERTPLWDPLARGALVGLTPDTGPAEIYRALVESLGLVLLDHSERLEAELGPAAGWRVTGGGARHELWLQSTADALGTPLEVAEDAAEAVGPALLALRSLGAEPPRRVARSVHPDARRTDRLRGLLPRFRKLGEMLFGAELAP
jgi:xylulokinase